MDYLTVKYIHILSSTLLFGTGLGSAFYMFFTNLSGDVRAIAVVTRRVVWADWMFTTPTAIIQPATGLYMMHLAGMPFSVGWIAWSIALFILALPLDLDLARCSRVSGVHRHFLPDDGKACVGGRRLQTRRRGRRRSE